jgi:hypothetical protein
LHQLDHADKRQKISDQVQSEEVAETMNHSADVDSGAKGNYMLTLFKGLLLNFSDILAPGPESSSMDNTDMEPALGGQVKEGPRPPVVQSVAGINVRATPTKSQSTRVKKVTTPTRIQPKRSSRR